MDQEKPSTIANHEAVTTQSSDPRSLAAAERGIRTGAEFASLMSHLMSDIISGRVTPQIGNAACNAGGKLLKIVEMQYKFGTQSGTAGPRVLQLVPPDNQS
jgi:hypothetical protein